MELKAGPLGHPREKMSWTVPRHTVWDGWARGHVYVGFSPTAFSGDVFMARLKWRQIGIGKKAF